MAKGRRPAIGSVSDEGVAGWLKRRRGDDYPPPTPTVRENAESLAHPKSTPTIKGQSGRTSAAGRASSEDASPTVSGADIKVTRNAVPGMHPKSTPSQQRGSHHSVAGPFGAPAPAARPQARSTRTPAVGRLSDEGKTFTDKAKVNKEKAKATKSAKKSAGKVTKSAANEIRPEPRPAAAAQKGGLGGILAALRSNKDNQRLAKERQTKAGRKG